MNFDASVPDNVARLHSPLEPPKSEGNDYYSIGEVARLIGMSTHTLRWYERIGLLGEIQRDARGQRVFRNQDLEWLRFLTRLRLTGMPVEDMVSYANYLRQGVGTLPQRRALLMQHRQTIIEHMGQLQSTLDVLNYKIDACALQELERKKLMETPTIPTVQLGNSGPHVGLQGLGCLGMSAFYGDANDESSRATLEAALDAGVTLFDTADMYGQGANEEFLAPFIATHRDEIVIATKFGIHQYGSDPLERQIRGDALYVRQAAEASLRRLGVDAIDLYYLHRRDVRVPLEETVSTMAQLVQEGKVKHLGLSEVTAEELREAHAIHPIAAVQSEWSLFSRDIEKHVVPTAAELGVALVPYSPLGRGFLTGAFNNPQQDLAANDVRRRMARFSDDNVTINRPLLKPISEIAARHNVSLAEIALAWVHSRARIHNLAVVPIPGTRQPARLAQNLSAVDVTLTDHDLADLEPIADHVSGLRYPAGSGFSSQDRENH